MFNPIKQLFGLFPKTDYAKLVREGAIVLDVRSKGGYDSGHIKGSVNIFLDTLKNNLDKLEKDRPVIICCTNEKRSATAKRILKSHGFTKVYNGGGWRSLQGEILKDDQNG